MYYNKEGEDISRAEWFSLIENKDYRIIKRTILKNGMHIITQWVGCESGTRHTRATSAD